MNATRRKRGPYGNSRFRRKVVLLASKYAHLSGRAGFDAALASLLMELDRLARRGAYRPKVALALHMLARRLDDCVADGVSTVPSVAMLSEVYVGESSPEEDGA